MKKLEESYDVWYNTDTEEIKSIMINESHFLFISYDNSQSCYYPIS